MTTTDARVEIERLRSALEGLLDATFDPRRATAEFDRFNYAYFLDTGYQRPGKDDRLYDTSDPENRTRFNTWLRERITTAIDAARAELPAPIVEDDDDD